MFGHNQTIRVLPLQVITPR